MFSLRLRTSLDYIYSATVIPQLSKELIRFKSLAAVRNDSPRLVHTFIMLDAKKLKPRIDLITLQRDNEIKNIILFPNV